MNEQNEHLINEHALDLLDKMLKYDQSLRITAKDAMEHQYFNDIRE